MNPNWERIAKSYQIKIRQKMMALANKKKQCEKQRALLKQLNDQLMLMQPTQGQVMPAILLGTVEHFKQNVQAVHQHGQEQYHAFNQAVDECLKEYHALCHVYEKIQSKQQDAMRQQEYRYEQRIGQAIQDQWCCAQFKKEKRD